MSERRRRPGASWSSAFSPRAQGLIAIGILTVAGVAALRADGSDDEPIQAAVKRARSCVLKVECVDRAGTSQPTVLSGVALDDKGHVLTVGLRSANNRTISVKDCSGKRHDAQWIATDEPTGLTLLKLEPGVAQPPTMSAALPEVGSAVFVVGNPYGLSHSVSVGVVSGLDRSVSFTGGVGRGLIQFTAPVFPGDGGGLLADRDGRMLGIVSTALNDPAADDASGRRVNGIGFAIPARELRRIAQRLREGQRVERGYLGLTAEDVEQGGVRVVSVLGDSPAQRAGLREGDVIQTMNDRAVEDFDDLAGQIERLSPGTEITLHGKRGDDEFTVQAVLGERPVVSRRMPLPPWPERWDPNTSLPRSFWDMEAFRRAAPWVDTDGAVLGVRTQPITETLARSLGLPNSDGALISSVVPGSPADRAGLRALDVIVGLNGEPVQSSAQLYERIRRLEPAATVQIDLMRDGETKSVEVTLAQPGSDFTRWRGVVPWPSESQRGRLELLEERVKALEAKVSELQKRLDAKNPVPAPSER